MEPEALLLFTEFLSCFFVALASHSIVIRDLTTTEPVLKDLPLGSALASSLEEDLPALLRIASTLSSAVMDSRSRRLQKPMREVCAVRMRRFCLQWTFQRGTTMLRLRWAELKVNRQPRKNRSAPFPFGTSCVGMIRISTGGRSRRTCLPSAGGGRAWHKRDAFLRPAHSSPYRISLS